jgi:uncharacterized protein
MTAQPVPRAGGVRSPCASVCRLSTATDLCEGCYRTIDEIAAWSTMTDPQRLDVWRLLRARRKETREAGHATPVADPSAPPEAA